MKFELFPLSFIIRELNKTINIQIFYLNDIQMKVLS